MTPSCRKERAVELGVKKVELDELLAKADFITLRVPLTDKTRNILSRENLAKTKKGVRIVNAARGGLIDEEALADAAEIGPCRRRGAGCFRSSPPRKPAVQPAERGGDAASGRLDQRGAGECRVAGGRADGGLPADRRGVERAEHALGHGRGGCGDGPWIKLAAIWAPSSAR